MNEYLLEEVVFINTKYIFHNTNGQLKTGKTGTHSSADTSPVQCSLCESTVTKLTKVSGKQMDIL